MKLYFVRHAEAEECGDDAARKLTAKGVAQSNKLGKFFASNGISFDMVYSSPLIRAVQTAEYILMAIDSDKKTALNQTSALLNETSQEDFEKFLKGLLIFGKVLLVGHSPSIEERVRNMLGIENKLSFKMPKASVACIETENGVSGVLKFFISHKLL